MDHPKWHVILFWSTFNIFSSCVYGLQEYQKKVQYCWLIIYDSFWHCHSQLEVRISWDKRGTRPILSQFEIIWMTLNRLVPKLVAKHSKTRSPLELWTAFNYLVTLSNSKSVTKSSQYVTWPLNWYHIIWPKYNMGRKLKFTGLKMLHMWHMSHFVEHRLVW